MQYKIVKTCYEYGNPVPYMEEGHARYSTRVEAECSVYIEVIEELNTFNMPDENGHRPECSFSATMEDEKHDCVVLCWDGDDYMPVTCYDIVEVAE